mmetsp:Transcript_25790/g.65564  ORF Transcript_25790/g.65564 Transcript_25790/m.65564 type:complete len:274 (-) Transcript_25790:694-1515(-)
MALDFVRRAALSAYLSCLPTATHLTRTCSVACLWRSTRPRTHRVRVVHVPLNHTLASPIASPRESVVPWPIESRGRPAAQTRARRSAFVHSSTRSAAARAAPNHPRASNSLSRRRPPPRRPPPPQHHSHQASSNQPNPLPPRRRPPLPPRLPGRSLRPPHRPHCRTHRYLPPIHHQSRHRGRRRGRTPWNRPYRLLPPRRPRSPHRRRGPPSQTTPRSPRPRTAHHHVDAPCSTRQSRTSGRRFSATSLSPQSPTASAVRAQVPPTQMCNAAG